MQTNGNAKFRIAELVDTSIDNTTPMAYTYRMLIVETSVFTRRIGDCMSDAVVEEWLHEEK